MKPIFLNADAGQEAAEQAQNIVKAAAYKAEKTQNLNMAVWGIAGIGQVGGLVLAYRQKKKFWGYVGYFILGGLIFGGLAAGATFPFRININNKAREIAAGESSAAGCCG